MRQRTLPEKDGASATALPLFLIYRIKLQNKSMEQSSIDFIE